MEDANVKVCVEEMIEQRWPVTASPAEITIFPKSRRVGRIAATAILTKVTQ
jgi:hypothetical protein